MYIIHNLTGKQNTSNYNVLYNQSIAEMLNVELKNYSTLVNR